MKKCFKCGIIKPISEYYKHRQMTDGHLGKCKVCTKLDTKIRLNEKLKDPIFKESEKERHRKKYHRLEYRGKFKPTKDAQYTTTKKYRMQYPEKYKATMATSKLKRKPGIHKHHWSYNEEHFKDFIELELSDHATAHRFIIYDQERKMYRTTKGILLDTKEAHIKYISQWIGKKDT